MAAVLHSSVGTRGAKTVLEVRMCTALDVVTSF